MASTIEIGRTPVKAQAVDEPWKSKSEDERCLTGNFRDLWWYAGCFSLIILLPYYLSRYDPATAYPEQREGYVGPAINAEKPTQATDEVKLLLDLALQISNTANTFDSHWRGRLENLISEITGDSIAAAVETALDTIDKNSSDFENGYRLREVRHMSTNYLILLPPDPPQLVKCNDCGGQKVPGSSSP